MSPENVPIQPDDISRESVPEQEPVFLKVPKDLGKEISPTVKLIYGQDEDCQKQYHNFKNRRMYDPVAKMLDTDRAEISRKEERELDELIDEKIRNEQASDRDEAIEILTKEYLHAPPIVQQYWRLIRGLNQEEPIDLTFLTEKLRDRHGHEDRMLSGLPPDWQEPEPPKGKARKRIQAERDKMDRFLTQLGQVQRGEYGER